MHGLHGANRLASNSLSECFVFGARAARGGRRRTPRGRRRQPRIPGEAPPPPAEPVAASRRALWRYAGLQRDGPGLRTLAGDEHPLVRLIATAALAREESRGAHLRLDFPQRDPAMEGRHVTLEQSHDPTLEHWSLTARSAGNTPTSLLNTELIRIRSGVASQGFGNTRE